MLQHPVHTSNSMRVQNLAHHTSLLCSSTEEHATDQKVSPESIGAAGRDGEDAGLYMYARSTDMPELLHAVQAFAFVQACNS